MIFQRGRQPERGLDRPNIWSNFPENGTNREHVSKIYIYVYTSLLTDWWLLSRSYGSQEMVLRKLALKRVSVITSISSEAKKVVL